MRTLIVVFAILAIGYSITDREICQQGLNGIFEQNKLKDPTTIMNCASDDTTHKIVAFIGKSLDKAAKGSVSDLISLIDDVKNFVNSLPPAELDCVSNNPEALSLLPLYHIDPNDTAATERKLIAYVTLHYLTVHKWLVDEDNLWKAAKYYETGFNGAGYLHQILGASIPTLTDKEIIQQLLNGIFEQNKLKDPTTIVVCIDDDSAHKIVVFVGQLLDKAAKGSVSDLISLKELIQKFGDSLDPAVGECLKDNPEFNELSDAYNLTGADSSEVEKRVITYITLHYLSVHKWLGEVDSDYHNAKYYTVGWKAGEEGHVILGNKIGRIVGKAYKLRRAAEELAHIIVH